MSTPSWWEAVLLAGAAFRVWRLLGADTVLDRPRDWLVRADDADGYRQTLDEFLHCPWCLGFWVAVAWWAAWQAWPESVLACAVPFAVSAVVGLVGKLDG